MISKGNGRNTSESSAQRPTSQYSSATFIAVQRALNTGHGSQLIGVRTWAKAGE